MQHSHEALDRPGGFGRGHLLSPLRHRDFRVLWAGMTVSLIGDGISAEQVAEWSGTISYEVLTALGGRVKRTYRE